MFFGIDWLTALCKISFQVVFAICSSIIFYLVWNTVAPVYLVAYLPTIWLELPFWHIVSMSLVITFIGEKIKSLVPTIVKVNNISN